MGYLVNMHLVKEQPDVDALRAVLPTSIDFRVYRHNSLDIFAIDTFSATRPPEYPFTSGTPTGELSVELGPHLHSLAAAYEDARRARRANGIKRSYINLAEALSEGLQQPVLSISTDDDNADFACLAAGGKAEMVTALCDDTVVRYVNGTVEVVPAPDELILHQYAVEAFEDFTGARAETIGLGSWDPPDDFGFVRLNA